MLKDLIEKKCVSNDGVSLVVDDFFANDKEVICFWAGTRSLDQDLIASIWGIASASSVGNLCHIFSVEENYKINAFISSFIQWIGNDKIKFTILKSNQLNYLPAVKRANLWAENIYANFSFWLINNSPYEGVILSHNDICFRRKISYRETQ